MASDYQGRLERAAKLACNLWNHHVEPRMDVVIRLVVINENSSTTGYSYVPVDNNVTRYCKIELNKKFFQNWSDNKTAGTIAHEIGHTLGYGWKKWTPLWNKSTGRFKQSAIDKVPALINMRVQLRGGNGVEYSHWDENLSDKDLMTPFKDIAETVMPVTFDVLELLGHKVHTRLKTITPVDTLLHSSKKSRFDLRGALPDEVLQYHEESELFETLPHKIKKV